MSNGESLHVTRSVPQASDRGLVVVEPLAPSTSTAVSHDASSNATWNLKKGMFAMVLARGGAMVLGIVFTPIGTRLYLPNAPTRNRCVTQSITSEDRKLRESTLQAVSFIVCLGD